MPEVSPRRPWIQTPLVESASLSKIAGCRVFLKLENLQPSGSFKSRGIGNYLLSAIKAQATAKADTASSVSTAPSTSDVPHFYCSSGGNAGLACVVASTTLGYRCTIVTPTSTKQQMVDKMRVAGADVVVHGASWFEADQYLQHELMAKNQQAVYVPPFDHPEIWKGASTMVDEWEEQLAIIDGPGLNEEGEGGKARKTVTADAVICSVGGGGMFSGIMEGLERNGTISQTTVIAVETIGADSLNASVKAGKLVTLPAITSIATTLGAKTVCKRAFEYAHAHNNVKVDKGKVGVRSVVRPDKDAVRAVIQFANEERLLVEPSCGVSLAVAYGYGAGIPDGEAEAEAEAEQGAGAGAGTGGEKLKDLIPNFSTDTRLVVVVCGGSGVDFNLIEEWKKTYNL